MQHLKGSGTPVLYIGRTVLKGCIKSYMHFCARLQMPAMSHEKRKKVLVVFRMH
jgi:hypothetical protein